MWEKFKRYFEPLIIGLCIGSAIVLIAIIIGKLKQSTPPLESVSAASWQEYWINRYQTLLAGLAAVAAAFLTIRVMRHQIEKPGSDAAREALTRYELALFDVMEKHKNAIPPQEGENDDDALARLQALRDATDNSAARAAMLDPVFGMDRTAVAHFLNRVRFSATGRVYGRDDQLRHTNMVWPLYMALTNGMTKRKAHLERGGRVEELYTMSTIHHAEFARAFVENRAPDPEQLERA